MAAETQGAVAAETGRGQLRLCTRAHDVQQLGLGGCAEVLRFLLCAEKNLCAEEKSLCRRFARTPCSGLRHGRV